MKISEITPKIIMVFFGILFDLAPKLLRKGEKNDGQRYLLSSVGFF